MRNIFNKLMILLTMATVAIGCSDDPVVVINEDFNTQVTLSNENVVLEESNEGMEALTVTWSEPDFGYNAAAEYNILFDLASGDFSTAEVVNAGQAFQKVFTTEELNKIMLNLGVEAGAETAIQVKVDIVLSNEYNKASEAKSMMVTAYSGVLDLSSPWGVVGSATPNGWGDGPDTPFYKTGDAGVYVAYITMIDGEWKIRRDNDWAVNYGSNDQDGNLQRDGGNISVTAGSYKITFDENAETYTIEAFTWGLVGSATPNGWDGPDTPLAYDPCSDTWKAVVKLETGEWKIRQNNDWAVNYGSDANDGTLQPGGGNIPVDSGYYQITVDFTNLTYEIVETEVWGVVGSGYNDWGGAGPDFAFTPDYCTEGLYHAYGVTLLDGEIKFRVNNDWAKNLGDTGLDGILDDGGDNIPSTAGTYDITLDFTNPSVPTYTITAK